MKRVFSLLLIAIFSISLIACGNKSEDNTNTTPEKSFLDEDDTGYYVTSNLLEWKVTQSNKMTKQSPDKVTDSKIDNVIKNEKSNISMVYTGIVSLNNLNEATVKYNGQQVSTNLLFEVVASKDINDVSTYYKIPSASAGAKYKNLTPSSLLNVNEDNVYTGAAAKAGVLELNAEYIVVLVRYNKDVNGAKFGLGLIFNKSNASNPDDTPTNPTVPPITEPNPVTPPSTPVVPGDDKYDSNNGEDILPTSNNLADNVQDGLILHAWNWSYNNIRLSLEEIANAGYTTVQVSPVQQPRDYKVEYGKGWAQQWWKFYQPVSFAISNNSWLGTKAELTQLCQAADSYGIKIIVDIVANHTANVDDVTPSGRSTPALEVKDYEAELYNNKSQYFRNEIKNNDSNIEAVVHGNIGMPDLKTETKFVQNMVLDLLKECIDCGVDGFRFDAAKHIETPDDGQYASDFWPTILNGADSYAKGKNVSLYYYGEILNTPGNGRSWTSYTKYMSITDNQTGNNVRNAIVSKNVASATATSYLSGQPANKLVLWAESHDTYANTEQESTHVSQADINKTWALVASRKDATALYFARPGEVGSIGTYDWKSVEVSAVNNFHNQFIGADEQLYYSGNYSVVERYSTNGCGAVIVNVNGNESNVNFKVKNLKDGSYIDVITGNTFTVSNSTLSGKMGKTGIVVISSIQTESAPIITVSQAGGFYSEKLELTVDLAFATEARVIIGSEVHYITESKTFTINNVKNAQKVKVEVSAVNDKYRVTEKYEFIRLDGVDKDTIVVTGVPSKYYTDYDIYAWVWKSGSMTGNYVKATVSGEYVMFKTTQQFDEFLLAANKKGYSFDWAINVKHQTNDFLVKENAIYVADQSTWKEHTE